jgi:hypothetical protein
MSSVPPKAAMHAMNKSVPHIVASRETRNARLIAQLRSLYARALDEPVPEEWRSLAERIEAAVRSRKPPTRP